MSEDVAPVRFIECKACSGEGRIWVSRWGGNDPDVWDAGQCPFCDGSGNQRCELCTEKLATHERLHTGDKWFLCKGCHDQWLEDDNA